MGRYQGEVKDRATQGLGALGETFVMAGQPLARPGLIPASPPRVPAHTINFKSVVGFEVAGSHFTHHRKHVQEVVQGHVAIPILGEDLGNPLTERVVLETGSREPIPDQDLGGRALHGFTLNTHLPGNLQVPLTKTLFLP